MKKRYDKTDNQIALYLLAIVVLLVVAFLVQTLESEELVHGQVASDWYLRALNVLSVRDFS